MLRRIVLFALPTLILAFADCDNGTGPGTESGNVDVVMDAAVARTDSGVTVDGTLRVPHPSYEKALLAVPVVAYDFGGFPELDAGLDTRMEIGLAIELTHRKPAVYRNDSTILSYVDHGDVIVEGDTMMKFTYPPQPANGTPVGYDNFISYSGIAYATIVGTGGVPAARPDSAAWYDALAAGSPVTLRTTGSSDANPVTATFSMTPLATLIGVQNGDDVPLDVDAPPAISTVQSLALQFDRPVDPAHTFVMLEPFGGVSAGARRAFAQPREATDRIVIPGTVLWNLSAAASASQVAYRITIEEIVWQEDVFTGTLAGSTSFSLPFTQAKQTVLLVYLEH
jgi:hypothetical protein